MGCCLVFAHILRRCSRGTWIALRGWSQGVLAAVHVGMSDLVALVLESLTTAFAVVFTWEAAIKLLAIGPAAYFREGWNR